MGWVIVDTAPELCQKSYFFAEKEDERNLYLCSGIYAIVNCNCAVPVQGSLVWLSFNAGKKNAECSNTFDH